jgi:hypothetical protein
MVLPDGHSVVGTNDGTYYGRITFAGPNFIKADDVKIRCLGVVESLGCAIYAAPSRTADGKIVVVQYRGDGSEVVMIQGGHFFGHTRVPGQSIASAAVSRNHVFVATANAFLTFDAATSTKLQKFTWNGGGLWPPAIGPDGRVYAMASDDKVSNILHIFPPPTPASGTK